MDQLSKRRIALAAGGASLLAIGAIAHPSADIHIITHEASDISPRKVQAAVDVGVMAVSVLYTWTERTIRR
ncbi:hypothetical protein ABS767_09745 [Sphingomonas sp. ST-64]|uniref:Uncharacterized protein n=1 Tax=Sphingomonas plantiphila TaxID=3163295 RepID=A0ABW8YQ06_9SPHN